MFGPCQIQADSESLRPTKLICHKYSGFISRRQPPLAHFATRDCELRQKGVRLYAIASGICGHFAGDVHQRQKKLPVLLRERDGLLAIPP